MNPIKENQKEIEKICQENNIDYLGLFGSFARGHATSDSDIDLLVRFGTKKSLFDLVRIERTFQELFHMPVDLVTERSVSPHIKDRIYEQLQKIYERA